MDAVDLLSLDHRNIEKLFSEFQTTTNRSETFEQIRKELLAHAQAEEEAFYPVLEDYAPDEVKDAIDEHHAVEAMLLVMASMDMDGEDFSTRFSVLMKNVQDHIGEEEAPEGLMGIARQNLTEEDLSEVANQIQEIKADAEEAA